MEVPAEAIVTITRQDLDELDQLINAATQAEWNVGHTGTTTIDDAVEHMRDAIRRRDAPDVWMVFIGDPNDENGTICPAYTGNGPTSRANAEYLAAVQPRNMRWICAALRTLLGNQAEIAVRVPNLDTEEVDRHG